METGVAKVSPSYETILVERRDRVAIITINRPEKRNALNIQTRAEGAAALALASATVALDVIINPNVTWSFWIEWVVSFLLAWFMGIVLRRQVRLVAELRLARGETEERARQVAVLEERQRLSRELHDSVTQSLYGISLYAEAAGRALSDGDSEPVATNLHEIREATQEALGEMRLLLFELRPPLLQEQGLAAALGARLRAVEARAGLVAEFDCPGNERLPSDKEQELYRLAQEALNNVLKHAHAGRIAVRLAVADGHASLQVADDGVGSIHPCRPPTALVCGACANGRNDSAALSALKARLALEHAFRLKCRDDSGQREANPSTTGGRPRGCPEGAASTAGPRIEY